MTRASAPRLLGLALAALGALPTPARVLPATLVAQKGPAAPTQPASPGGRKSGLEARVERLTRALSLDATQQAALRKLLLEQRQEVRRIWGERSLPAAERVAATRVASERTADRIRALLNEEQRKRYDPPPQGDPGRAIGNAHVEDWMEKQKRL